MGHFEMHMKIFKKCLRIWQKLKLLKSEAQKNLPIIPELYMYM